MRPRDLIHLLEIGGVIGREAQLAIAAQSGTRGIEKVTVYQAPLMMFSFWPWIWKHDVKHRHRSLRQQVAHGIGALHTNHPQIPQALPNRATADLAHPAHQTLHAEKVVLRMPSCHRDKKCPLAATHIDLKGRRARK